MKIVFISIPSIHALRWINQLNNTDYDIHWIVIGKYFLPNDIVQNNLSTYYINPFSKKSYFSRVVNNLHKIFNKDVHLRLEKKKIKKLFKKIKPDLVHSFELQTVGYVILDEMLKNKVFWIYSIWGSDLYFYRNHDSYLPAIHKTLGRVNYLMADCHRDISIAKELGYTGVSSVFPGGGGFEINNDPNKPISSRTKIAIKGYQHKFGMAMSVVNALIYISNSDEKLFKLLTKYQLVFYACHNEVLKSYDSLKDSGYNIIMYSKSNPLNRNELLELFNNSIMSIGNSISDGIPNTMLESMMKGAIIIQSNPGGATSEVIEDNLNGFLIRDPYCPIKIANVINNAFLSYDQFQSISDQNRQLILGHFDREAITDQVISIYNDIHTGITN